MLGFPVVYKVLDDHRTTTIKGELELQGSVHHAEMEEFAGVVTRSHPDGKTHDLMLFVPNKPAMTHIHDVEEGAGPHQFRIIGKHYPEGEAAEQSE